jgi:anti-sigma factor RsiW
MSHPDQPSAAAIDALLAGHALGDLDDGERQQLAALLRQRPELRSRLDEFSTTLDLLPLALPATAGPPARLRRRLLESPSCAANSSGAGRSRHQAT